MMRDPSLRSLPPNRSPSPPTAISKLVTQRSPRGVPYLQIRTQARHRLCLLSLRQYRLLRGRKRLYPGTFRLSLRTPSTSRRRREHPYRTHRQGTLPATHRPIRASTARLLLSVSAILKITLRHRAARTIPRRPHYRMDPQRGRGTRPTKMIPLRRTTKDTPLI